MCLLQLISIVGINSPMHKPEKQLTAVLLIVFLSALTNAQARYSNYEQDNKMLKQVLLYRQYPWAQNYILKFRTPRVRP